MAQWEGKSRGTPLGYKIFVVLLGSAGLIPAYLLLVFVVFYYFLFSPDTTRNSYRFFRVHLSYSRIRSLIMVYWDYFMLGQSIIDKVAVMAGLSKKFSYTSNGGENLSEMAQKRRGGIMLGAHLGNWEIAGHFVTKYDSVVNILMFDGEHEKIKNYIESVTGAPKFRIIPVKSDLSHVYLVSEALSRGELICMHADRFMPGSRTISVPFLGESARFPQGPFQLVRAMKAPFTYVYGVKTSATHYDFYARPLREVSDFADMEAMVTDYAKDLESVVRKYPGQWFNYYDFWAK